MNLQIKDILLYSPIDNKHEGIVSLNIDDFFDTNTIFIPYPPDWYKSIKDNLQSTLHSSRIITFHGAASKGKTTFLHYISLKDKAFTTEFNFCLFNLVYYPSPFNDSLIDVLLQKYINKQLENYKDIICQKYLMWFNNNIGDYLGLVDTNQQSALFKQYIIDKKRGKANDFFNDLKNSVEEDIDYTKFLFLIFMTNHMIIHEKEIREKENIVFVIDDLDELSTVYLTDNFYSMAHNLFSKLQTITKKIFGSSFLFAQWGRIILSFRDTNYHLITPIADSSFDSDSFCADISFDPAYKYLSLKEIISKRVDFFKEHTNEAKWDENTICVIQLLDILFEKDTTFFEKKITPLFNYDGRAIIRMILEISKKSNIRSLIKNHTENYRNIFNQSEFGARGILFLAIFIYLYEYNTKDGKNSIFFNIVSEEIRANGCNHIRMGLTQSRHLSKYNNDNTGQNLFSIEPFHIRELCRKHCSWYDTSTTIKTMNDILNISAKNFEKFVIIDYSGRYEKKQKIKEIIDNKLKQWITYNDDTHLEDLRIILLPSSIIYSEDIFIHYEYCNLVRFIRNESYKNSSSRYTIKTIFQLLQESNSIKAIIATIKYQLDYIYIECSKMTQTADDFFCKTYKDKYNCNDMNECKKAVLEFKEDGFVIGTTLFASRLITNHIQYLNDFRKFLFNKDKDKKISTEEMLSIKELNSIVLETIKKYIDLYNGRKEGLKDLSYTYDSIFYGIINGYNKAITILDEYIPIDAQAFD